MKKVVIVLSLLLLTLSVYPQTKRPVKKPTQPAKPVVPAIPPTPPCFSHKLKESPMLEGLQLGSAFADISKKLNLKSVLDDEGRPIEGKWMAGSGNLGLTLTFQSNELTDIRADYKAIGPYADVNEYAAELAKKLNLLPTWDSGDWSPIYRARRDALWAEKDKVTMQRYDYPSDDPATSPRLIALNKKKDALEKELEDLKRVAIHKSRVQTCVTYHITVTLPTNDTGIIELTSDPDYRGTKPA